MRTQKVSFQNANGDTLAARLALPANMHPKACALFAHCFTCNKNLAAVRNISRALTSAGFAVMRFDFTGLGESEGDFADTNFSSTVEDLVAAANKMGEMIEMPSLLIGHSLGGAAVLLAACQIDSVNAIATIGAPAEPVHVQHHFDEKLDKLEEEGIAEVKIGGRPFTVKKQFLEDIRSANLLKEVRELKKSVLIMHSPHDKIVGVENAKKIYDAAFHPKSFISLDGADHLLNDKADSLYVGDVIASWAKRYIEFREEAEDLKVQKQVVVQTGREKYTTQIQTNKHSLIADEPSNVGGNDFGPTPYDLLLAALGACTSMTLRMYADRKKWNLETITVHLLHDREHAKDSEAAKKIDVIERQIEVEGDLTEEQKKRLLEIADRCPVHKTLHNKLEVRTTMD